MQIKKNFDVASPTLLSLCTRSVHVCVIVVYSILKYFFNKFQNGSQTHHWGSREGEEEGEPGPLQGQDEAEP